MASNTLDILDAFFALRPDQDFSTVPGRVIHDLGEEIRRASGSTTPFEPAGKNPIYIGGWPSANFGLVRGDLLLSSLLYNEHLLIRDPIADWFSNEQYQVEHMMSARPGYWDFQQGRARTAETRQFLNTVVHNLRALRPLIDAGIISLVPTASVAHKNRAAINTLLDQLTQEPGLQAANYSTLFSPADVPVEDNVRGMFVFAPDPDPRPQISSALRRGLLHFAREYIIATAYGATYTAAFDHELFLCRTGARSFVPPSARVTEAVLQSQLSIFTGLTPKLIADIHDDTMFGQFRSDLHELFQHAPTDAPAADLAAYVSDQERVLLQPRIDEVRKSVERGLLGRIGAGLNNGRFGIAAGLVTDMVLQSPGLATVLHVGRATIDGFRNARSDSSRRVWSSLVRHNRTFRQELRDVQVQAGNGNEGWPVPSEPSMSVLVSPGSIIHDFVPRVPGLSELSEPGGYSQGSYRPCSCGSGLKYRFCCEAADRRPPRIRPT